MGLFRKNKIYDRTRYLRSAQEAQKREKHKRALPLLRRVLVAEPNNPEIHAMIAPSLAACGWEFAAWQSYEVAANAAIAAKKGKPALLLYRDATRRMPKHYDAWMARFHLERRMTLHEEAKKTLDQARQQFRDRRSRSQAIAILRLMREIAPEDPAVQLDLIRNLAKTGQQEEALLILEQLAARATGRILREVRRAQWRITPTLNHTWLWLRSSTAR